MTGYTNNTHEVQTDYVHADSVCVCVCVHIDIVIS